MGTKRRSEDVSGRQEGPQCVTRGGTEHASVAGAAGSRRGPAPSETSFGGSGSAECSVGYEAGPPI